MMPRRQRLALIGLLTALVMATSIVGISSLSPRDALLGPPGVADQGKAPPGWRTEFYRNIAFRVPALWGSDVEPLRACREIPPSYPRDNVARKALVLQITGRRHHAGGLPGALPSARHAAEPG